MDNYDKLLISIEHNRDTYMPFEQAAGATETPRSVSDENLRLLNAAIADLAESNDCKYCAHIDQCTLHQIERNFAYKSCNRWLWRGVNMLDKTADTPFIKQ